MSNIEGLQFPGPAGYRGGAKTRVARTAFASVLEQLLLFGLFAGGAASWLALIWWIVR